MLLEQLIPLREPSMRVELDKKALFALASDTRLDILKSLQPMRRTVTQLADTLGIDKAAVHRHLKTLEEGGFVRRYEDHGFVYYGLSWKSRDLLSPNDNTRVVILLSACIVFIGVLALIAAAVFMAPEVVFPDATRGTDYASGDASEDGPGIADLATSPDVLLIVVVAVAISTAIMVTAAGALRVMRRPRQPGMSPGD